MVLDDYRYYGSLPQGLCTLCTVHFNILLSTSTGPLYNYNLYC